jgi:hypothetical protein
MEALDLVARARQQPRVVAATAALLAVAVAISLPFETRYTEAAHAAAREPLARLLTGALVVGAAAWSPVVGGAALLVAFLWLADVRLVAAAARSARV